MIILLVNNYKINQENKNLITKEKKLNEEIISLNEKVEDYLNKLQNLNKDLCAQQPSEEIKKCTFTKTFYYYQTLNYIGQVEEKYIVVGEFQGSRPIILKLDKDFNYEFKNDWYEITFEGTDNFDIIGNQEIISIKKTDKLGFDQIQESCN